MNREILFRAKCSGVWRYGNYVHLDKKPIHYCYNDEYRDFIVVNGVYGENHYPITDLKTLGQYTGLKDKNGKQIFEGDIISHGDPNIKYLTMWRNAGFAAKQIGASSYIGLTYWASDIEVLGNVTDNPELMK